ncbi:hypothetical protein L208DRAFT_1416005 [Tricholoma matsutake]|nr:hypothetical protein L208DRAFT_1416005 [Tricholoma matsutake 945]
MSLITSNNRLTVKTYAFVPSLDDFDLDLPSIKRATRSVSSASSRSANRGIGAGVPIKEGCMVTKVAKYTHQLAHFVNAVRKGDPRPLYDIINDLSIIPIANFTLDDPSNLAYLEAFVHTSLDLYGFIAVAPSASTLASLTAMVKSDNDARQQQIDEDGSVDRRSLDFSIESFTNPEYELVAIYPEHFLPGGATLTVRNRYLRTSASYVASRDHRLRLSSDPNSPRLPPFRHEHQTRPTRNRVNVFLVAINAELKFRRYFEEVLLNDRPSPLPADVHSLMQACINLIDLIYWTPKPTEGSKGHAILNQRIATAQRHLHRAARPDPARMMESSSREDTEMEAAISSAAPETRSARRKWFAEASMEQRRAYGTMLMSSYDNGYHPALLEDINDNAEIEGGVRAVMSRDENRSSSHRFMDKLSRGSSSIRSLFSDRQH